MIVVFGQAAGYWSQVEITLFTTSSSMSIVRAADAAVATLDQHSIKVNAFNEYYEGV